MKCCWRVRLEAGGRRVAGDDGLRADGPLWPEEGWWAECEAVGSEGGGKWTGDASGAKRSGRGGVGVSAR